MERAYSVVTITKAAAAEGIVEGLASVPAVDRQGDIVEPKGVRWRKDASGKPDVPWLYQHRHDEPIGRIEWLQAKPEGLRFRARMAKVDGPPSLKERLESAFASIASGLVRGISIGFMPLKAEPIETGWRFKEISLYEISSVTIPACEEACVEVVKRYDEAARRGETLDGALWGQVKAAGAMGLDRAEREWNEAFQKMTAAERKGAGDLAGFQFLQGSIHEMLKFLAGHVEATERRLEEQGHAYKGVWKPGATYPAGSFVTSGGSMWHADKATDFKPGEGGGWTLAVKRGADAKERSQ